MASSPTRVASGDTFGSGAPGSQKEAMAFLGQTSGMPLATSLAPTVGYKSGGYESTWLPCPTMIRGPTWNQLLHWFFSIHLPASSHPTPDFSNTPN